MRIVEAWHLDPDTHYLHARARDGVVYALGAKSELVAVSDDAIRWKHESGALSVRSFALGTHHVFVAGKQGNRLRLAARRLDGELDWSVQVEAKRVGRIFANARGRVFLAVHQSGRLALEIRHQHDGTLIETKRLERKRLMMSRNGAFAWTRDADGITQLQLVTGQVQRTHLGANGFMVEVDDGLVAGVGSRVVRIVDGRIAWASEIPARDLRLVAEADGLGDEQDVWEADLGRLIRFGSCVVVAALHGTLYALDLETGALRWKVESAHYPSAQGVATSAPIRIGERDMLLYPASDEELYLVDDEGGVHARHELPLPFDGVAVSLGDTVVLPASGLRGYVVEP